MQRIKSGENLTKLADFHEHIKNTKRVLQASNAFRVRFRGCSLVQIYEKLRQQRQCIQQILICAAADGSSYHLAESSAADVVSIRAK